MNAQPLYPTVGLSTSLLRFRRRQGAAIPILSRMSLPADEDTLYAALLSRDPAYDGSYFVSVTTTGVYCRLTCPARKPKRANVRFFSARAEAECAGFRACLRCRPDRAGPAVPSVPTAIRQLLDATPERRWTAAELRALGHDPSTVRRAFQQAYGVTFAQFARMHRLGAAMERLRDGASVIEAQLDAAYESGSGFREAVVKLGAAKWVAPQAERVESNICWALHLPASARYPTTPPAHLLNPPRPAAL